MSDELPQLEAQLADTLDPLQKIDILFKIAWILSRGDLPQAIQRSQETLNLVEQLDPTDPAIQERRSKSLYLLGACYYFQSRFDIAAHYYLQAIAAMEGLDLPQYRASLFYRIGRVYIQIGDYARAAEYFQQGLEIARQLGDKHMQAQGLNDIGYMHVRLNEPDQGIPLLNESLQLLETIQERSSYNWALGSLAEAYLLKKEYAKALNFVLRGAELCREFEFHIGLTKSLILIGSAYHGQEELELARQTFEEALGVARRMGYKLEESAALRHLGDIYCQSNQLDKAFQMLEQALDLAEEVQSNHLLYECHYSLSQVCEQAGLCDAALENYKQFHLYKEIVYNEQADLRLKTIEVAHRLETARQEAQIYHLKNVELQREIDERKKAQAALEELAITDPLTGIMNRRHFYQEAVRAVQHAARYQRPIAVIMLDIDHFKSVNDQYGHPVGDQVLINLAQHLHNNIRAVDLVARYGGEEFVILLPETRFSRSLQIAERLRSQIADLQFSTRQNSISVTVSMGVADTGGGRSTSLETLLDQADQALYRAKQAGRNRVAVYEQGEDEPKVPPDPPDLAA